MQRVIAAAIMTVPLFLTPLAPSEAAQPTDICGTGPYAFSTVTEGSTAVGLLPSVRKQISGLGLMAKMGGCTSFSVVCYYQPSGNSETKTAAKNAAASSCGAIKTALVLNMRFKNSAASKAARTAVRTSTKPATGVFAAGTAMVTVKAE